MTRYLFDDMWSIGEQIARAESVLLCMEFDGVLASEREDETQAVLSPQMQRVLWALASQERHVMAFLSYRSRIDLQMRIGLPDVWYAGCHGLEISGPGNVSIHPTAAVYSEQLQPVAEVLERRLHNSFDVACQDRGLTLRLPLHDQPAAVNAGVRRIAEEVVRQHANLCKLVAEPECLEIRPAVTWNRGSAAHWIAKRLPGSDPVIIYLGGEDESVFLTLEDAITIRVGESEQSAAQYYLAGPPDVRRFLEWVGCLSRDLQGLNAAIAG